MQMMRLAISVMRYLLYLFLFTGVTLFVILTKMPWIYDASFAPRENASTTGEEIQNALWFVSESGDFDYLISFKNSAAGLDAIRDEKGNSLLHYAAYEKRTRVCQWLIETQNFDPNITNNLGFTPLDCVMFRGSAVYDCIKSYGGSHSWKYNFWLQASNPNEPFIAGYNLSCSGTNLFDFF